MLTGPSHCFGAEPCLQQHLLETELSITDHLMQPTITPREKVKTLLHSEAFLVFLLFWTNNLLCQQKKWLSCSSLCYDLQSSLVNLALLLPITPELKWIEGSKSPHTSTVTCRPLPLQAHSINKARPWPQVSDRERPLASAKSQGYLCMSFLGSGCYQSILQRFHILCWMYKLNKPTC